MLCRFNFYETSVYKGLFPYVTHESGEPVRLFCQIGFSKDFKKWKKIYGEKMPFRFDPTKPIGRNWFGPHIKKLAQRCNVDNVNKFKPHALRGYGKFFVTTLFYFINLQRCLN